MRRLLFIIFAFASFGAASAASAEPYECVCLKVPAQDCSADATMVHTHIVLESSSQPEADPGNCSAKCGSAGQACDLCKQCLDSCAGGGKTCQLWWLKSSSGGELPPADRTVRLVNPLKTASIPELVANVLKAAVGIVGALALLVFVYGGFLWLTSGGEAGKVQQGKDAMKWAAVGLVVVFSSYALVSFVLEALTG